MPSHAHNHVMSLRPNIKKGLASSRKTAKPRIEDIFRAEESPLLRYAYGIVARREVAEEIVQDAFLKLHKHWDDIESPRAWLYRAIRNLCLNHLRKHQRETLSDETDTEYSSAQKSPDHDLAHMEAIGTLRILIEELSPEDRQLIELKYTNDLSYGSIGERLELGTGNVGYKLHHLLKKLSIALQNAGITSSQG